MTDILIRGMNPAALARLEARASELGLSRNEFLRRQLAAIADTDSDDEKVVTAHDLRRASRAAVDLDNAEVMSAAWQ